MDDQQVDNEITSEANGNENNPSQTQMETTELAATESLENPPDDQPITEPEVTETHDEQAPDTEKEQDLTQQSSEPTVEKVEGAGETPEESQVNLVASTPKVDENGDENPSAPIEIIIEEHAATEQVEEAGEDVPEQQKVPDEGEPVETDGRQEETPQPAEEVASGDAVVDEEVSGIVLPVPQEGDSPLPVETELPQPGTPDQPRSVGDDEEEEDLMVIEEEEEPEPQYNRDELVQQYQAAVQERDQLNQQNRSLQHKLSEYFRKKKTDEVKQEVEKTTIDQEQRYMKYMSNLEELRQQQAAELDEYNEVIEDLKLRRAERQAQVEEEWNQAVEFKRGVAMGAINSRSGRPIPLKDIEMYEMNEKKKEGEVALVRLENIKLKNRLKKQEGLLKQKEELAEGLHLIDFEQLKIENQTYNEKIEERNEELLKLRKKITTTVQVLTHLKEKLQFVQAENAQKKDWLAEVERDVAQKRDILSRTKQARDSLRHQNTKLQQKCGLLGNTDLLRDFEVSTDEVTDLEHKLDMLKRTHAELTLSLNGIKKKIEMARENQS